MESETKIDSLRILSWLNEKYFEVYNNYDEVSVIYSFAKQISAYNDQKRNISSI